jgi:hypothetical protein
MNNTVQHGTHRSREQRTLSNAKIVLIGFLVIIGYFLIMEHRAHLSGGLYYLPFLFLLACPVMHIFMHGGHGGHNDDEHNSNENKRVA